MNAELADLIAFLKSQPPPHEQPLPERRAYMDRAEKAMPLPDGMSASPWSHGDLRGQWITNGKGSDGRVVLYLHGGGFMFGSSKSHRHLAARIADRAGSDTLVLDYRLAPEHPFPAGLDDAVAAYSHLLERYEPGKIAVAGDSAGGGLTLSTLLVARDRGLPLPAAMVCLSPWLDLTGAQPTADELAKVNDPTVRAEDMPTFVSAYLNGTRGDDPLVSPLCGSLAGLPPALIQAGSAELFLRDSTALAAALKASGGEAVLEIVPDAPHVWQWFWPRLQLARESLDNVGAFLKARFA